MNANPLIVPSPTRSLWPFAISLYFFVAFCGVITFIVWSVHQNQDLVSADYYKEEILFQQKLNALNRALPFAKDVGLHIDENSQAITVFIPSLHAAAKPTGTIRFYRPSEARLDFTVPLAVGAEGKQTVNSRLLKPGFWKARVDWTFQGEDYVFEKTFIVARH